MEPSQTHSQIIYVRVNPSSKKGPLVEVMLDGKLLIYVREAAVDDKANGAALILLAKHLGVSKSHVVLISGAKSRLKRFQIS